MRQLLVYLNKLARSDLRLNTDRDRSDNWLDYSIKLGVQPMSIYGNGRSPTSLEVKMLPTIATVPTRFRASLH